MPGAEVRTLHLAGASDGTLAAEPGTGADDCVARIPHRATTGTRGPLSWGAGSHPNGLARDLRPDEARGATWTGETLADALSVIGRPVAILHLTASMPVARRA